MGVNTLEINRQSTIHSKVKKSNFKTAKSAFQNRNLPIKNNKCLNPNNQINEGTFLVCIEKQFPYS